MAYAQSALVRSTPVPVGAGVYRQVIVFTESDMSTSDEWTVEDLPPVFDLVSYKATLTSGTGTAIGPLELGSARGFGLNTQGHIATSSNTAAAHVNDQTRLVCPMGSSKRLVGRTKVDAASDNVVSTELVIEYKG